MSKKILFIYRVDKNDPSNQGVIKKLLAQVVSTQSLGHHVDYIVQAGYSIMLNQRTIYSFGKNTPFLITQFTWYNQIKKSVISQSYDIVIIRYGLTSPSFLHFLKEIKKAKPNIQIVIDMPTYPYEKEWSGIKGLFAIAMDRMLRRQLQKHITYMIHLGPESTIFNIPTIHITNGIDPTSAPLCLGVNKVSESINVIAIGKWQYWHGLDRLLSILDPADNWILHVVGEGVALPYLQEIVRKRNLENIVVFHGTLVGTQLDNLFDRCQMGIGTLGIYRKGMSYDSSLKHREYCLRGVPFVLCAADDDFPQELPYVCYLSWDKAIDLSMMKSFYASYKDQQEISQQMRFYAINALDWKTRMIKVLETL